MVDGTDRGKTMMRNERQRMTLLAALLAGTPLAKTDH
jgi:hypothetical protein